MKYIDESKLEELVKEFDKKVAQFNIHKAKPQNNKKRKVSEAAKRGLYHIRKGKHMTATPHIRDTALMLDDMLSKTGHVQDATINQTLLIRKHVINHYLGMTASLLWSTTPQLEFPVNATYLLERLGLRIIKTKTVNDIRDRLREYIPKALYVDILDGKAPPSLKNLLFSKGKDAKKLYYLIIKRKKRNTILDNLYDLSDTYKGISFHDVALKKNTLSLGYIRFRLRRAWYAGEDIGTTTGILRITKGRKINNQMKAENINAQSELDFDNKPKHVRHILRTYDSIKGFKERFGISSYMHQAASTVQEAFIGTKHARNLVQYMGLPGIEPKELSVSVIGITEIGALGEKWFKFVMNAISCYDPEYSTLYATEPELAEKLRYCIGTNISRIMDNSDGQANLNVYDVTDIRADARLISDIGDVLVEVKTLTVMKQNTKKKMESDYTSVESWKDRELIANKVAILNTSHEIPEELRPKGFTIFTGREMYRIGLHAIYLLDQNLRDFPMQAPIQFHDYNTLRTINENVALHPHILHNSSYLIETSWTNAMLTRNTPTITISEHHKERTISRDGGIVPFPFRSHFTVSYTHDFFAEFYGPEIHKLKIEDQSMWDSETAGLNRSIHPIILFAEGYLKNGEMMLEVMYSHNPVEEINTIEMAVNNMHKRPNIVTFNGNTFDWPMFQKRAILKRINIGDLKPEHVDVYVDHRGEWDRRMQLDRANLGSYESARFGKFRKMDLTGSKIPEAWIDYLFDHSPPERIREAIVHIMMDVITLSFYVKDKKERKLQKYVSLDS